MTRAEAPTAPDMRRPAVRAGQEREAGGDLRERGEVRPTARPSPAPAHVIRAVKELLLVSTQAGSSHHCKARLRLQLGSMLRRSMAR